MAATTGELALPDARPALLRVCFVPHAAPGDTVLHALTGSAGWAAVVAGVGEAESLPPAPASADELLVLYLPAGAAAGADWPRRAEAWIAAAAEPDGAVDLVLRSDRILWRPGCAVLIAPPERRLDLLAGLAVFAGVEVHVRRVEADVDHDWPTVQEDIPLTHGVSRHELDRRLHVNEMTRRFTLRRMQVCDLERTVDLPVARLPAAGQRVFAELCGRAELADRLASVDDRVEVAYDLYELANDRLSEFQYFRSEWWLEIWIIVILLAEVVLILFEIGVTIWGE